MNDLQYKLDALDDAKDEFRIYSTQFKILSWSVAVSFALLAGSSVAMSITGWSEPVTWILPAMFMVGLIVCPITTCGMFFFVETYLREKKKVMKAQREYDRAMLNT